MQNVKKKKLLLIGTPRGGTGYCSKFLTGFSLKVGHEKMQGDGVSDWAMLPFKMGANIKTKIPHNAPYRNEDFETLVHVIREPYSCITTMVNVYHGNIKLEDGVVSTPFESIVSVTNKIDKSLFEECENVFDVCAVCYLFWHEQISKLNPDFVFRIEKNHQEFVDFLSKKNYIDEGQEVTKAQKQPVTLKGNFPSSKRVYSQDKIIEGMTEQFKSKVEEFKKTQNYE
jgi:hypothetical protein